MVGCWHGYLSGVRCRFAYGPADATATISKIQIGSGPEDHKTDVRVCVRMCARVCVRACVRACVCDVAHCLLPNSSIVVVIVIVVKSCMKSQYTNIQKKYGVMMF